MIKEILLIFSLGILSFAFMPSDYSPALKFGLLKYSGGGDWYSNPTALPNLARFCNKKLHTNINPNYETVDVGSSEIFNFSFIHMTGHGNVVFSDVEAENLRLYLQSGGFLHIDDNYGMDPFVRIAMKKVFPDLDWVELPFSHEIYHKTFEFSTGLPKIHKHDGKPAQGFALIWEGRVVCFYSYETDLGDGWEDQEVHNDSDEMRTKALRMGANIVQFAFEQ
ncbi:MAG: DUF4159 domain-containing protein [Saprospiraceae bacterium]|nr:DUF4159 domain-containing protein [Saprospiraceae bacterium]